MPETPPRPTRSRGDTVHHFYTSEFFCAENEPGQHPRHVDMIFPLWNVFDLSAEGRPQKAFPQLEYPSDLVAPAAPNFR